MGYFTQKDIHYRGFRERLRLRVKAQSEALPDSAARLRQQAGGNAHQPAASFHKSDAASIQVAAFKHPANPGLL